jgi:diaminopimelate decarboxylase
MLGEAAATLASLRRTINDVLGENRVTAVDIGGGLAVAYRPEDVAPTFQEYASTLRREAPELFEPRVRLITEFGRAVHAPVGFAATRVEYVEQRAGRSLAYTHLGADFLLRAAYAPADWYYDVVVLDGDGNEKTRNNLSEWTVSGPLCFAGDLIARDRSLPAIAEGDWLLIRDVGAYSLSMWSRHCSRSMPPVIGLDGSRLRVLRQAETSEDVVAFWSRPSSLNSYRSRSRAA